MATITRYLAWRCKDQCIIWTKSYMDGFYPIWRGQRGPAFHPSCLLSEAQKKEIEASEEFPKGMCTGEIYDLKQVDIGMSEHSAERIRKDGKP